jgi:ribosomal protein S18 acetylase RimI-like enzyme
MGAHPTSSVWSLGAAASGLLIRDFRPADQHRVRELILAGMRERWREAYDPSANPDVEDMLASYVARGAEVIVAEIGSLMVGTGTLQAEGPASNRIIRMAVAASHRRLGVARTIVNELLNRAGLWSAAEVVVRTDTDWLDAVALYRACGFQVVAQDRRTTDFRMALR